MSKAPERWILGAGLSGLAAAYRLKTGFRLLERRRKPGGLCETVEEQGYRFDRTGHLFHSRHPEIRRLFSRLLDEEPLAITRRSHIFSLGVYTRYPFQANTFGLPPAVIAECLVGFAEAQAAGAGHAGEAPNFEEFIYRHFGPGIARHFMIPYNTKLWGVHPREIGSDWCQRFVPRPSIAEVVDGALGLSRTEIGYNADFLYPRRGIAELPEALARRVGPIAYGVSPGAVDAKRRRILVEGRWQPYRAIVSTIPLDALVRLLVDPPARVIRAAERLRCTSLRYLDVALSVRSGTGHHWSYVPERKYPFYRVGCYSNFSEAMAPPGRSNLYVELASRRAVPLARLMPRVVAGLAEMGIIRSAADIAFVRPRRLPYAYVVYDRHHRDAVSRLLSWLEEQRIFCAGRYARWEYSAMEDALLQGFSAAEKVKELDR